MTRLARAAAAAAITLASAGAHAVTLVGLTSASELARIDTADIAGATTTPISGLASGDRLVGIDLRPGDGRIYGVSLMNRLYTVDAMTGMATQVAMLATPVVQANLAYGLDFNPVADFNGAASLRLVSSAGGNYAVNASTGAVGNTASNIGGGFTGVAYTNSMPLPAMAPPGTALYYINSSSDMLMMAPASFNSPVITAVGALGVDVLKANGFDIANGMGYAALNVDDGSSLATGIYRIDLGTGAATLLGTYNGTLSGLTVSPVPEPQSLALMLAGIGVLGLVARRRTRG
jgi:hypothetical protein